VKKDKNKKLTLNKETLRDLMAKSAGEVKGGAKTNGKKCRGTGPVTQCGAGCPPQSVSCFPPCYTDGCW
jgi:hypothetical protein